MIETKTPSKNENHNSTLDRKEQENQNMKTISLALLHLLLLLSCPYLAWAADGNPTGTPESDFFLYDGGITRAEEGDEDEPSKSNAVWYRVHVEENFLKAESFDDQQKKKLSSLSLSGTRAGISIDEESNGESYSLQLPADSTCLEQSKRYDLLRWLDMLDSAEASGNLDENAGSTLKTFRSLFLHYFTTCESIVGTELENESESATGGIISDGWAANAWSADVAHVSMWPFNVFRNGKHYQTFCYLSRVQFRDIDTPPEGAYCEAYFSGIWRLRAVSGGSDAGAYCRARCVGIPR